MKIKFLLLALLLAVFGASSARAAILYAAPADVNAGNCTFGNECDIAQALAAASPGDTIILIAGSYTGALSNGEFDITKDFLTIQGPYAGVLGTGVRAAPAIFDGDGYEYIFGIAAHNVTIEGIDIDASATEDTWAGIRILPGGWDRWTIQNNLISGINDTRYAAASGVSNFSYGIYGDAQVTTGSLSMTGGLITGNYIHTLGKSTVLIGANVASGVGIYLEGIEGEDADCDFVSRFTCGVWIYENQFEDLYTGQNQWLQGITTPGGKEYSYGIFINQDAENSTPNNGAWIGGNDAITIPSTPGDNFYLEDDFLAAVPPIKMEVGVRIGIGGSTVNEKNTAFGSPAEVVQFVINEGRKATVSEITLAPWFKTLYPRVFGQGTDVYTRWNVDAIDLSDDSATIVEASTVPTPDIDLIVRPYGESASYKVSLDSQGAFNLRFGARLLFAGPLSDGAGPLDGVNTVLLHGTQGNDLLTVDFNNGNPIPNAVAAGLSFNPDSVTFNGGFDTIALRGDEQLDYQTVEQSDFNAGTINFDPTAPSGDEPPVGFVTLLTGGELVFDNLDDMDDVLIVNEKYSLVVLDDVDNEINVINGPFRYGFETFQINSGPEKTFQDINFASKKNVHIYGADDTASPGNGDDIFTVFTEDGDAPDLILSLYLWGGSEFNTTDIDPDDDSDDYFVVRPSADFPIYVDGGGSGTVFNHDYLFLDCAATDVTCTPSLLDPIPGDGDTGTSISGFETVYWSDIDGQADDLSDYDIVIKKEIVGFAVDGAHPGDDLDYRVTLYNNSGSDLDLTTTTVDSLWVTDAIDHRLSLIEQSVVTEAGSVDITNNRSMLWLIEDFFFADGDSISMTYTTIVNTLITTDDIHNYASILNHDSTVNQTLSAYVGFGDYYEHYAHVDLDVLDVFGWPLKAAINSALFYETEAGPRYIVGLYGGAKDPAQYGMGAVLCRVPSTNQEVGWDGGLGNLWYSCGEGLPNNDGIPEPLIVTDIYQDSAGRLWLTSWGHSGLFYSDDGAQTWIDAEVDLSGGQGGFPDGLPDGFAQIYAISEDILGTLFISANNGDVYRSFDRGSTWQKAKQLPQGSADTAFSLQADPTLPGTLYAGTFGDSLYVTNDFGETWNRPEGNGLGSGYIFDIEFDPLSGNLFVGTAQGIYYSPDGGDNWTGLNSAFPIPSVPPEVRNIAFDENGSFFASTWGQGVWFSTDWQAFSISEFALKVNNAIDLAVYGGSVFVMTDTGEQISFRVASSASSVDTEDVDGQEVPREFALDQNYPNPFNPTTTISFNLPQSSEVSLTVYDLLGRQVALLVNGQMTSGRHNVTFQASELPSGMYLYRLTTPSGQIAQKMILLK